MAGASGKIAINLLLAAVFIFISAALIAQLAAEIRFNAAEAAAAVYKWRDAEKLFREAMRIDPASPRYIAGYGDFLALQAKYRHDKAPDFKAARDLYMRAAALDGSNAGYPFKAGLIDMYLKLTGSAFDNFKKAAENDPNGFNAAYSAGCAGVTAWKDMDEGKRGFVLGRLRTAIEARPSFAGDIYSRAWRSTGDIRLLRKITPHTLEGQKGLYSFLTANNLWQFRKGQARLVDFYRRREEPLGAAEEAKKEALELGRVKGALEGALAVHSGKVEKEEWRLKAAGGDFVRLEGPLYGNDTVYAAVSMKEGGARISIRMRKLLVIKTKSPQDPKYNPYAIVKMDGDVIGETFVAGDTSKPYEFFAKTGGGTKILSVSFVNDIYDPAKGQDRNLVVEDAEIFYDEK